MVNFFLPGYPNQTQQAGAEEPEGWGDGFLILAQDNHAAGYTIRKRFI